MWQKGGKKKKKKEEKKRLQIVSPFLISDGRVKSRYIWNTGTTKNWESFVTGSGGVILQISATALIHSGM